MGDFKKMEKAYGASAKIMEKKMEKERPLDLEILKKVKDSSIIIVAGSYDKIELVLDLIKVPYVLIEPHEFNQIDLKPRRPGKFCPGLSGWGYQRGAERQAPL